MRVNTTPSQEVQTLATEWAVRHESQKASEGHLCQSPPTSLAPPALARTAQNLNEVGHLFPHHLRMGQSCVQNLLAFPGGPVCKRGLRVRTKGV